MGGKTALTYGRGSDRPEDGSYWRRAGDKIAGAPVQTRGAAPACGRWIGEGAAPRMRLIGAFVYVAIFEMLVKMLMVLVLAIVTAGSGLAVGGA